MRGKVAPIVMLMVLLPVLMWAAAAIIGEVLYADFLIGKMPT